MGSDTDVRKFLHQVKRAGMSPPGMDAREPHTIAKTRKFIQQAKVIFGSVEIEFERDGEWDADSVSIQITKKQAREIISILTDKGDLILCHFDGYTLQIT